MDADRRKRYAANLAFYQGQQWQSRPKSPSDRQLTFNYTETILTTVAGLIADHLRVMVTAPLEQPERATQAANLAWQRVAEENALTTLDYETELDPSILGDACYP